MASIYNNKNIHTLAIFQSPVTQLKYAFRTSICLRLFLTSVTLLLSAVKMIILQSFRRCVSMLFINYRKSTKVFRKPTSRFLCEN